MAAALTPMPSRRAVFTAVRIGLWCLLAVGSVFWITRREFWRFQHWRLLTCAWLTLGLIGLGAVLWGQAHDTGSEGVYRSRNFYGVLTVEEHEKKDPDSHYFLLRHGRITHGLQFVDPAQAMLPVSYYGPESGIGLGVAALPDGPPAHRSGGSWHRHDGGVWPGRGLPALL